MKWFIRVLIFLFLVTLIINLYMIMTTRKLIDNNKMTLEDVDCILVLGAGIRNNSPSPMLEDRLKASIKLYEDGVAKKILVSGDHQYNNYDEVNVMKNYLIENGIPSEDIFMDHAGLSSYDSMYRAKKIFKANRIVVVTQKYHLYRSLYIARMLDIDVYGVSANPRKYYGQTKRDVREYAARVKDFFKCLIMPEPTYLGEVIPINGNGDVTNDN